MMIFPDIRIAVCSAENINDWLPYIQAGQALGESVRPASWQVQERCHDAVGLVQGVLGLFAVGSTAVQMMLAIRVNAFAAALKSQE